MTRSPLPIAILAMALAASSLFAADAPRDKPAATKPARPPEQIQQDLQKTSDEIRRTVGNPEVIFDADKRKEVAPKVIPPLKAMVSLLEELAAVMPTEKSEILNARLEFLAITTAMGDADSTARLDQLAKAEDPAALDARCARQLAAWWTGPKDETGQAKVLETMRKIAKENPKSDTVAQTLIKMSEMGPANKTVAERARAIITADLTGEFAQRTAIRIQCEQLFEDWRAKSKDEPGQSKILDEMQKLAKANPKSDMIAQCLAQMSQSGTASQAIADRAVKIITDDLKSDFAADFVKQMQGQKKMRDAVGKPVELTGTTLDGKPFTTKDWKGKVILVDFWATWCGPCIRELPRLKKAYIQWHAKGLEILGVSCDVGAEDLKGFLDKNKEMQWPQLFDPKENPKEQWHPLAREWGINAIPAMFLIDKNGILRSTDAREKFEEEIPKLLEEK